MNLQQRVERLEGEQPADEDAMAARVRLAAHERLRPLKRQLSEEEKEEIRQIVAHNPPDPEVEARLERMWTDWFSGRTL